VDRGVQHRGLGADRRVVLEFPRARRAARRSFDMGADACGGRRVFSSTRHTGRGRWRRRRLNRGDRPGAGFFSARHWHARSIRLLCNRRQRGRGGRAVGRARGAVAATSRHRPAAHNQGPLRCVRVDGLRGRLPLPAGAGRGCVSDVSFDLAGGRDRRRVSASPAAAKPRRHWRSPGWSGIPARLHARALRPRRDDLLGPPTAATRFASLGSRGLALVFQDPSVVAEPDAVDRHPGGGAGDGGTSTWGGRRRGGAAVLAQWARWQIPRPEERLGQYPFEFYSPARRMQQRVMIAMGAGQRSPR